jgi:CPA1 family monovalent cation:H+ antiporter
MLGLDLVVALGVAVLVSGLVARRFRVAPPVVLLACGALIGFVVRLRDENRIDDTVLRQIQARLDIEEVRLSQRELVD